MEDKKKSFSAAELAEIIEGELRGNPGALIDGVSSLEEAGESSLSFLGNAKYAQQLAKTKAAAILVEKDFAGDPQAGQALISVENATVAFAKAINIFAPPPPEIQPGIHPAAVVHPSAKLAEGASIAACAVIDAHAEIGENTTVGAGVYIGQHSKIGANSTIHANVSIRERCIIGNRVLIHSGSVIGSDGFGFAPDGHGGIIKIPQVGIVQIDDDVEIGANCTIDRARFGRTWLKFGVKLDNMVHIAHNVVVGECSMLIGQSGVAGSTKIGQGVIIAAQAGINGHITIGDGARVGGTSGVVKSVPPGGTVIGTPAEGQREFVERLTLPKKVKRLQQKLKELEAKISNGRE